MYRTFPKDLLMCKKANFYQLLATFGLRERNAAHKDDFSRLEADNSDNDSGEMDRDSDEETITLIIIIFISKFDINTIYAIV